MTIYNERQYKKRFEKCRRVTERRDESLIFGSFAWVENIKKNYLAWPKFDRREVNRRDYVRRIFQQTEEQISEKNRAEEELSPLLLTQEEKTMIMDLYLN